MVIFALGMGPKFGPKNGLEKSLGLTHSYVSQVTHAFLGMLSLCSNTLYDDILYFVGGRKPEDRVRNMRHEEEVELQADARDPGQTGEIHAHTDTLI